jgi:2-keto-4-pentenoate hydratase
VVVRLLGAHNGGEAVSSVFVDAHPLSISDGLEAQAQVQDALGPVGAWKVSSSSSKEKPNFAPILSKQVYGKSARFAAGTFRSIGIECEIAYRMARDLLEPPYTREEVADAIAGLVPLVEICDSRLADFASAPHAWRLADRGRNGAILIGDMVEDWRSIDTRRQPVTLNFGNDVAADKAGNANPDLVAIVQLLANQAGPHCGGVRAGQIIATGSMTGTLPVDPGTDIVARFPGLGELRASFET